jgi:speckle-type POZ protein
MQGMRDAWEQVKEMRGREAEAHQRAAFLAQGLAMAWKEGVHTDIVFKPGTGPPIPAHKAILVSEWAF